MGYIRDTGLTMENVLCGWVLGARSNPLLDREPKPGDLVVETTTRTPDPDAIGWLIAHDQAPYNEGDPTDGSVPMREVWDVLPLNPNAELQTIGGEQLQRWENAEFAALPEHHVAAAGLVCPFALST